MKSKLLAALFFIIVGCKKGDESAPVVESISITSIATNIFIGDSLQLEVSHLPKNAIKPDYEWTSDNINVLSVSQVGKIYANSVGEAIITVKTKQGDHVSQSKIIVLPIATKALKLNKEIVELFLGSSEQLSYTLEPDNATNKLVSWSSSNPTIAQISSTGEITAVGVGETTIEVASLDGKAKATSKVIVKPILISSLSLDPINMKLAIGKVDKFTVLVLPNNATNQSVSWASSNPLVAKVSSQGEVTALSPGTSTITVTSHDGKIKAESTVMVMEDIKYSRAIFTKMKSELLDDLFAYMETTGVALGKTLVASQTNYSIEMVSNLRTNRLTSQFGSAASFSILDDPGGNILQITSTFTYVAIPNATIGGFRWLRITFLDTSWEVTTTFGFTKSFSYSDNVQLSQLKTLVDEDIERQKKYIATGGNNFR